nr:MAG TPA: hypothetical protein [Caudoviricetes sp.]
MLRIDFNSHKIDFKLLLETIIIQLSFLLSYTY